MSDPYIYHICRAEEWAASQGEARYGGSTQDLADGFIHFSTGAQVRASAAKHRAGQAGLVLLRVAAGKVGDGLKWEPSRGGALFPHVYGGLPRDAVVRVDDLPLDGDGRHRFPADLDDIPSEEAS
ncbi:MAG: DUF952 domain-containing protein [Rhodobacterales bacterium]|nr:DUF952 domain-containing protein [Rhodobacterales bacterium]